MSLYFLYPIAPEISGSGFQGLETIHGLLRGYNLPLIQASYIPCVSEIIEYLRCKKCAFLHAKGTKENVLCIDAAKGVLKHRALALTLNERKAESKILAQFIEESNAFPESLRERSVKEATLAIKHTLHIQDLVSPESRSEVYFNARTIGIRRGKIDILEPDLTPVELKTGRFKSHLHRVQTTLYAFLIEFNERKDVDEAAIIYSYYGRREQFAIDCNLRMETERAISNAASFYGNPFLREGEEGCGWCN